MLMNGILILITYVSEKSSIDVVLVTGKGLMLTNTRCLSDV